MALLYLFVSKIANLILLYPDIDKLLTRGGAMDMAGVFLVS